MEIPISINIRKATSDDAPAFLALVNALAEYEKLGAPDSDAQKRLIRDAFGPAPRIEAYLAECDGTIAGYAIILGTYSSFLALPTLYLEDIFVLPEFRNRRIGYKLFRAMVRIALERGCGRMEWTVLTWNRIALDFYEKMGARRLDEWRIFRMTREQLLKMHTTHSEVSAT